MKRKVLSLLLCGLIACSMLTACGGSNSSNNAEVSDSDVSEKKDAEADSTNIEDLYVEAINSYQDYYEKVKSDFSGSQVGATITLDEEGMPLLWVAISEDGSKDNCRTRLVGYAEGEAAIMAERSEYIVPGLSSEIILGYGRINGNKRNIYVWDESKQDFRNIANEIGFESDVVYSEEELEEKINFLYPVVKALNTMSGSIQVLMNETTSQVAYIGYYDCSVFDTLQRLDVIGGLSDGGGETYGFYLKKEYSNNKVALSYYEKLADNNRLSADEEDAWWKKKYGSDMASDVIKDSRSVFTSSDGTVLDSDVYEQYLSVLNNDGWEKTGLSHPYADDVEIGQLLRGLANKPIYSQEELYLYMVSILYNCEITELNINDVQIVDEKSDEQHDYRLFILDIDYIEGNRDSRSFKLGALHDIYDKNTDDTDTDRIECEVSEDCKFIYYGEEYSDDDVQSFCKYVGQTMAEYVGDEQPLNVRVVVEDGKVVLLGIGYGDDLTN